jgi:hypothetical protein
VHLKKLFLWIHTYILYCIVRKWDWTQENLSDKVFALSVIHSFIQHSKSTQCLGSIFPKIWYPITGNHRIFWIHTHFSKGWDLQKCDFKGSGLILYVLN